MVVKSNHSADMKRSSTPITTAFSMVAPFYERFVRPTALAAVLPFLNLGRHTRNRVRSENVDLGYDNLTWSELQVPHVFQRNTLESNTVYKQKSIQERQKHHQPTNQDHQSGYGIHKVGITGNGYKARQSSVPPISNQRMHVSLTSVRNVAAAGKKDKGDRYRDPITQKRFEISNINSIIEERTHKVSDDNAAVSYTAPIKNGEKTPSSPTVKIMASSVLMPYAINNIFTLAAIAKKARGLVVAEPVKRFPSTRMQFGLLDESGVVWSNCNNRPFSRHVTGLALPGETGCALPTVAGSQSTPLLNRVKPFGNSLTVTIHDSDPIQRSSWTFRQEKSPIALQSITANNSKATIRSAGSQKPRYPDRKIRQLTLGSGKPARYITGRYEVAKKIDLAFIENWRISRYHPIQDRHQYIVLGRASANTKIAAHNVDSQELAYSDKNTRHLAQGMRIPAYSIIGRDERIKTIDPAFIESWRPSLRRNHYNPHIRSGYGRNISMGLPAVASLAKGSKMPEHPRNISAREVVMILEKVRTEIDQRVDNKLIQERKRRDKHRASINLSKAKISNNELVANDDFIRLVTNRINTFMQEERFRRGYIR